MTTLSKSPKGTPPPPPPPPPPGRPRRDSTRPPKRRNQVSELAPVDVLEGQLTAAFGPVSTWWVGPTPHGVMALPLP